MRIVIVIMIGQLKSKKKKTIAALSRWKSAQYNDFCMEMYEFVKSFIYYTYFFGRTAKLPLNVYVLKNLHNNKKVLVYTAWLYSKYSPSLRNTFRFIIHNIVVHFPSKRDCFNPVVGEIVQVIIKPQTLMSSREATCPSFTLYAGYIAFHTTVIYVCLLIY